MSFNESAEWLRRFEEGPRKTPDVPFVARIFTYDNDAVAMTLFTFALTVVLELASLDAVRLVCRNKAGARLYAQAVALNLVNNGILGPLAYELVNTHFMSPPLSMPARAAMVGAILVGHSIGYYLAHRWMHTREMYWAHKFHHRFNSYVVPVAANAVSIAEYAIAYMFPFIAGSALLRPDRASMFIAVGIISVNNLLIHTPKLGDLSARVLPWWAVSTADHLDHHKRLTTHWAAPTISIDRILARVIGNPESYGKEFKED